MIDWLNGYLTKCRIDQDTTCRRLRYGALSLRASVQPSAGARRSGATRLWARRGWEIRRTWCGCSGRAWTWRPLARRRWRSTCKERRRLLPPSKVWAKLTPAQLCSSCWRPVPTARRTVQMATGHWWWLPGREMRPALRHSWQWAQQLMCKIHRSPHHMAVATPRSTLLHADTGVLALTPSAHTSSQRFLRLAQTKPWWTSVARRPYSSPEKADMFKWRNFCRRSDVFGKTANTFHVLKNNILSSFMHELRCFLTLIRTCYCCCHCCHCHSCHCCHCYCHRGVIVITTIIILFVSNKLVLSFCHCHCRCRSCGEWITGFIHQLIGVTGTFLALMFCWIDFLIIWRIIDQPVGWSVCTSKY